MNKEIEKKEYVAPAMTVVEISYEGELLVGSGTDILSGDGENYEEGD